MLSKAQRYSGLSTTKVPLTNRTIVVTGATSGIGLGLTKVFSKLGATVVAVGRSSTKLKALREEIPTVVPVLADLSNLSSISRAADEINGLERVDILVNNAGMHMGFTSYDVTDDGFDKVFAVNYLSHVLLTAKLLKKIQESDKPVIAQVSSSFHFAVDGSDLQIDSQGSPVASRPGGSTGFYIFRAQRSYCNSKLAQIYHSRSLQKEIPDVRIVNICPGWVATNIASKVSLAHAFMSRGFSPDGWGIASSMEAIFGNGQDDFFMSSRFFRLFGAVSPVVSPSFMYKLGLRDLFGFVFAGAALFLQVFSPDAAASQSSLESYDEKLGGELHQWAMRQLSGYL